MRTYWVLFTSFFLMLLAFTVGATAVQASGYLKFDQSTIATSPGSTFQIQVIVDPGADQIAGTDAYVTYNSSLLEAQSVAVGTYFPSVSQNITLGRVSIWGTTVPASPKSGVGTIATVTFKALSAGSATLQYFCDTSTGSTSKVVKNDANATNIIDCALNQSAAVTISSSGGGGGSGGGTSPTVLPTQLPRSGGFGNTPAIVVSGVALVIFGTLIRYLII